MFQNNLHLLQKCYIDITVINNAKKNVICQGGVCNNLQILSYYIIIKQEKTGKKIIKKKKSYLQIKNRLYNSSAEIGKKRFNIEWRLLKCIYMQIMRLLLKTSQAAIKAMNECMEDFYGNPSSLHSVGQRAAEKATSGKNGRGRMLRCRL